MSALTARASTELAIVGAVCGILGVQVVLRRLAFFTETLGHITFLGIIATALVGSPLTAGTDDIAAAAGVAVLVAVALVLGHKELTLAAFDPVLIRALGYRTRLLDRGLLALLAITVVTAVPALGATLPLALLVGPAASALLWTRRILPATLLGGLLGATSGAAGLAISLHYRLATAAGTAVICGGLFGLAAATTLTTRGAAIWQRICAATAT